MAAASAIADAASRASSQNSIEVEAALANMRERGMMSGNHVLALLDENMRVIATSPKRDDWLRRPLDQVVSGAAVERIEQSPGSVTVTCRDLESGSTFKVQADRCVCALPVPVLRDKVHLEELWASGRAPWKRWD